MGVPITSWAAEKSIYISNGGGDRWCEITLAEGGEQELWWSGPSKGDLTTSNRQWASLDTSIATVTTGGVVNGVASGSTKITLTNTDTDEVVDTITVKVVPVGDESLPVNDEELWIEDNGESGVPLTSFGLYVGDNAVLYAGRASGLFPAGYKWFSSSSDVVSLEIEDEMPSVVTVRAQAAGTAVVGWATDATATEPDTYLTITVYEENDAGGDPGPVAVESVTLDATSVELTVGATKKLNATVSPDNATDKTVTWSSGDATVVSVRADGTVTGVAAGQTTITAKAGDKSATCVVTVKAADTTNVQEANYLEATVTVNGTQQRIRVYDPNGVLPADADLLAEVVTTHEHLDDGREIEHIISYKLTLVDGAGQPIPMPRDDTFKLCFEVIPGLDAKELEVVLVKQYEDGEFEEELVPIDGAYWACVNTNRCSPWSLIDRLSEEEKAAKNPTPPPAEEENSPGDDNNVKTGDYVTTGTVASLGMVLVLALGVMLHLVTSKKKFEM